MSFYGNLQIEEITYKFNIGKTFIKIKGLSKSIAILRSDLIIEGDIGIIKPSMIKEYILRHLQSFKNEI